MRYTPPRYKDLKQHDKMIVIALFVILLMGLITPFASAQEAGVLIQPQVAVPHDGDAHGGSWG